MAAFGAKRLAVDEEGQTGCRRLEDMAGGDDQVGAFAGFERADLVGDSQDLGRGQGHGLERGLLGQAEGNGHGRLERQVAGGRLVVEPPDLEWMATVTPAACSLAGLAYSAS